MGPRVAAYVPVGMLPPPKMHGGKKGASLGFAFASCFCFCFCCSVPCPPNTRGRGEGCGGVMKHILPSATKTTVEEEERERRDGSPRDLPQTQLLPTTKCGPPCLHRTARLCRGDLRPPTLVDSASTIRTHAPTTTTYIVRTLYALQQAVLRRARTACARMAQSLPWWCPPPPLIAPASLLSLPHHGPARPCCFCVPAGMLTERAQARFSGTVMLHCTIQLALAGPVHPPPYGFLRRAWLSRPFGYGHAADASLAYRTRAAFWLTLLARPVPRPLWRGTRWASCRAGPQRGKGINALHRTASGRHSVPCCVRRRGAVCVAAATSEPRSGYTSAPARPMPRNRNGLRGVSAP